MKTRTTQSSSPTHDVTCSECGTLFACACPDVEVIMGTLGHEHVSEKHKRRADRGWSDPCPDCNKEALEGWHKWLKTLPETDIREEIPNSGSWKS